jgi:hypothetical protein
MQWEMGQQTGTLSPGGMMGGMEGDGQEGGLDGSMLMSQQRNGTSR